MSKIDNQSASEPPGYIPHIDLLHTPVWVYDTTRLNICWANKAGLKLWESETIEELSNRGFQTEISDAVHQELLSYLTLFREGKTVHRWWQFTPKGKNKEVFCQFSGIQLEKNRIGMLCEGLHADISRSDAFMSSANIASTYNCNFHLISSSPAFTKTFGHYLHDMFIQHFDLTPIRISTNNMEYTYDLKVMSVDGERWHHIQIKSFARDNGETAYLVTQQDIHQRKVKEIEYAHQAHTDSLTGLLNRQGLALETEQHLAKKRPFTVYYVDLDGFKPINDIYGHQTGDNMLKNVARRLSKDIHVTAHVCRIGGDEFVLVAPESETFQTDIAAVGQNIVNVISSAFQLDNGLQLSISASVGFAQFPQHGATLYEVLANADAALYVAKQNGRRCAVQYITGMEEQLKRKLLLSQTLPDALIRNEISLYYQPIIESTTRKVIIVEALLRWNNHTLGNVSPAETIAFAEEIGLIHELESWVINTACHDLHALRTKFGAQVRMAINISGLHFISDKMLPTLENAVQRYMLKPQDIIIELTEGTLVPATNTATGPAHQLTRKGFDIAIDDFGTGYSSLAYLHRFPAKYVKIDQAFITRLHEDKATIACIHRLITSLGMISIAEGVETDFQQQILQQESIQLQQGFLISHPQPLQHLCDMVI